MLKFFFYFLIGIIACIPTFLFSQNDYLPFFTTDTEAKTIEQPTTLLPEAMQTQHLAVHSTIARQTMDLPTKIQFNLFDKTVIDVDLDAAIQSHYQGMKVYRGKSNKSHYSQLAHYRDVVIIYNPATNKITAQIATEEGAFLISPLKEEGRYQITQWRNQPLDCSVDYEAIRDTQSSSRSSGCEERDKDGKYVVDLFVGYSYDAAVVANDIDAHALSLVEMVNNGLQNSLVDNIYVRLVGTGIDEHNPGIVTSVLGDIYTWFEEEIAATGADFVASVQVPTGADGEAGGWAGVGGYSSVNSISNTAAVFRHELGHNIGSNHCTPGILPYASGYDTGNVKTHMCGNNVNFYSTPLVNDDQGVPLGDAATADNARVWRERAATVAARQQHTILYDEEDVGCVSSLTNGRYYIQNVNSDLYLATQNASTANGTTLVQTTQQELSNQWDIVAVTATSFRMIHIASGRLIDVPGNSITLGTNLIIWNSHGNSNQIFSIVEVSAGIYTIKTNRSYCMQIEAAGTSADNFIEQNTCDLSNNTYWRFIPIPDANVLSLSVATTDVRCFGANDGTATAVVTGGTGNYTYSWSNESTSSSISNLIAGPHSVTVSDGVTTIPYDFSIKQAASFSVSFASTSSSTVFDGTVNTTVSGGISPYTYEWNNGETTAYLSNLEPGLYSLTVTDGESCTVEKEVYIGCSDEGIPCDDNNENTLGDVITEQCTCVGIPLTCTEASFKISNQAIGKSATNSSNAFGGMASFAVDGNTDGNHGSGNGTGPTTHTDSEQSPWWEVDLGLAVDITGLAIWNRTDCCESRLNNFYVFISEAPFASTDLNTTLSQAGVWSQLITEVPSPNVILQPNNQGRYVRIQKVDEGVLSLAEVEVFACGIPISTVVIANPLEDNLWEIKGTILTNGRTITSSVLEYGATDFANSTPIDITGIGTTTFDFTTIVDLETVTNGQFRISLNNGFFSNIYTVQSNQIYCTPSVDDDLWYKRFNKVSFQGITYQDSGNSNYEDQTAIHFGSLDRNTSYEMDISVPSSGWKNLTYVVYIDFNKDGDFEDYHEVVGTGYSSEQTSTVTLTIPSDDIVVNEDLRMRILGNESGNYTSCYSPVGNYKDFSVRINAGPCQGTGYLTIRYVDMDGDGFGAPNSGVLRNCQQAGYADNDTDFNDDESAAYPGAIEVCDNIDNDGNGQIDDDAQFEIQILQFDNEAIPTGIYVAEQSILTNQNVSISNNSEVTLYAGAEIVFSPGFSINSGSQLLATIIEGCNLNAFREVSLPSTKITLDQNPTSIVTVFPNPFQSQLTVQLNLATEQSVSIQLHSLNGQLISRLADHSFFDKGIHQLSFQPNRWKTGLYYLTVIMEDDLIQKRVLFIE